MQVGRAAGGRIETRRAVDFCPPFVLSVALAGASSKQQAARVDGAARTHLHSFVCDLFVWWWLIEPSGSANRPVLLLASSLTLLLSLLSLSLSHGNNMCARCCRHVTSAHNTSQSHGESE